MLELLINGESADLLPDASITIDEESPVFDKDTIPGGYSYPFTLPVTPRNRRVLGFPERIEKSGSMSIEQPFQLFHLGKLITSGTITVTESGDSYKVNLMVGSGDLANKVKDKKLKNLDLGGVRNWQWKAEYKHPDDDFALAPIFNSKFYTDTPFSVFFSNLHYRVNAYEHESFNIATGTVVFAITPFPYLSYIIKQIFSFAGMQIIENVLVTDPDFRDLVVYTIRDIGTWEMALGSGNICIGIDIAGNPIYQMVPIGVYSNRTINPFNLIDSLPNMSISDFLLSIRNFLNIAYVPDGDTVRITKRADLIKKAPGKDITGLAIRSPRSTQEISDGFKLKWMIDSADDLWGSDFFTNIDDVLDFIKEPLDAVSELETLVPEPNEIRYIREVDLYFRYVYFAFDPEDETQLRWQWVSWSFNYQNYRQGNEKDVFESKIAPILMTRGLHHTETGIMRCPQVEQKGAYPSQKDVSPFELRLLFYRGMIKDSLDIDYPYVTNDNLDRTGTRLQGKSLALRFDGEYGLYSQLWKNYLTWWINKKLVYWTIKDPSGLSFTEKYAIEGKHYLLKKRTIILSQNGIEPAECEFYLV